MKRIYRISILILLIMLFYQNCVFSKENEMDEILESQQKSLNLSGFVSEAQKYVDENFKEIDVKNLMNSAITGKIESENILKNIFNIFGKEVKDAIKLMREYTNYCLNT